MELQSIDNFIQIDKNLNGSKKSGLNYTMYLDLILNLSLLVALTVISTFFEKCYTTDTISGNILQGLLFGAVAIIGMLKPVVISEGVFFDGRSIVISLCALFFGEAAVLIAMLMAIFARVLIGGTGVFSGILSILISALIGLYYRNLKRDSLNKLSNYDLLLFGMLVHVSIFLTIFTLPGNTFYQHFGKLAFGILLIYPIASLLAGKILLVNRQSYIYLEELETKNKELLTTLQSIADAVIITDKTGKIICVNHYTEDILNTKETALLNRQINEVVKLFNEDEQKEINISLDNVLKKGETIKYCGNISIISSDGRKTPVYASIAPIKLDDGKIIGAILIIHDCSFERKMTEELRENEVKYSTLIESGPAMIWTSNANKLCDYFNPQWLSFRGRTLEQELGNGWTEGLHPDDYDYCLKTYTTAFDKREPFVMEYRLKRHDGVYRWVIDYGVPRYDSHGKFIGYIGYCFDITDRVEAQNQVNLLLKAINISGVSVVITDKEMNIQWVNEGFTKLTGYSMEEAIGKTPMELLRSYMHDSEFYKEMEETLARGEIWRGERIDIRKDLSYFTVRSIIIPIKDSKSNVTNFVAIDIDITKLKSLEDQLFHAGKMGTMGTLVSAVIHDFNNALSVMKLATDELKSLQNLPHEASMYIQSLERAHERALSIVQPLLAFSRKQTTSSKTVVDLNEIVNSIAKVLQKLMGERIKVKIQSLLECAPVIANRGNIDQIILNLAVNARDAMPNGGMFEIKIDRVTKDELPFKQDNIANTKYIRLSFTDTGTGIPAEILPKIFDQFFTTKELGKGTGLGLSIVKQIVAEHNGFIDVKSEYGKGTTFTIYFPESNRPLKDEKIRENIMLKYRGLETIIVADDDNHVRELISSILTKYGYKVIPASNVDEAMELYKTHRNNVDLLLLDIAMPGKISVDEFYLEIFRENPKIKIILMSGYPDEVEKHIGKFKEGETLLVKPVSAIKLLEAIRNVLDKKSEQ